MTTRTSAKSQEVDRDEIECRLSQRGAVIWLTGLSAAGKSTIAQLVQRQLFAAGHLAVVLDGDRIRGGLCEDLGFSPEDRQENVRRVAHVAQLFADFGLIAIVALISPYREDRACARKICARRFLEVFVETSIETCEQRDPKGLYRRARSGDLLEFTGVSAPYEPPLEPELVLDCERLAPSDSARVLLEHLASIELVNVVPRRSRAGANL
jgi:adenylyl-sulfate kinase